jgi:ectoine hydroxylase-related dioxygenase (phytanoyl-CoA dioxygenase family)
MSAGIATPCAPASKLAAVSADDVAEYQRAGYVVTGLILPDDLLRAAEDALERLRSGERDHPLPPAVRVFDREQTSEEPIEQYGYLALQMNAFAKLVRHPFIASTAGALIGCNEIRLFHDRLIVKHPEKAYGQSSKIGWHTDRAYWRACSSTSMLTAWIPFQDCTTEIGTLMVIEGSHHWSGNDWMATAHSTDLDDLERRISTGGNTIRKVAYEVHRGQITFHHCRTLHASGSNAGSVPQSTCRTGRTGTDPTSMPAGAS